MSTSQIRLSKSQNSKSRSSETSMDSDGEQFTILTVFLSLLLDLLGTIMSYFKMNIQYFCFSLYLNSSALPLFNSLLQQK